MKEKRPYIALVFDLAKTPEYRQKTSLDVLDIFDDVPKKVEFSEKKDDSKEFAGYTKRYTNQRWAIFCECGHRTEFPTAHMAREESLVKLTVPVTCTSCNKTYNSSTENLKLIYSKSPSLNTVSRRFAVVERGKFHVLYSFATTMFVSVTTKKLIFKDIGKYALYLPKKTKAVKIKKDDKLITIPLRRLSKHCSAFINNMSTNVLNDRLIEQGLFERQFVRPLLNFCQIIESQCDSRDVKNILNILEKEREEIYFNSFFKLGDNGSSNIHEAGCLYNLSDLQKCYGETNPSRYTWLQYLKRRMTIMLAIYMYPPLATIVINHGADSLLSLLQDSSLLCSLTDLIRKKPTNPKDILEVMFKSKITNEFNKEKTLKEFVQKEKKKIRRKARLNPEYKGAEFDIKRIQHPTMSRDFRVPVPKDIKARLKKIQFKKSYLDLFLEDFNNAAIIFYGFLENKSAFNNIETIEKTITSNFLSIEESARLLFFIQQNYINMRNRLGGFKMSYKDLVYLLKILKSNPTKNKRAVDFNGLVILYSDTLSMLTNMQMPIEDIYKAKTYEGLDNLHNSLSQSYQLTLDKRLSESLQIHIGKFKHTETEIENIKFTLLNTPERFHEESFVMNHCVKTYCSSVADGNYIIYSIEDLKTNERATLSINTTAKGLYKRECLFKDYEFRFNQLKAKHNQKTTEKIILATRIFLEKFFGIKTQNEYDLQIIQKPDERIEDVILNNNAGLVVDII